MMKKVLPRTSVTVKFVGDEDVIENINFISDDKSSKKKRNIFYDHLTIEDVESILDEDGTDDVYQPSSVLSADIDEEVRNDFNQKLNLEASVGTPKSKLQKKQSALSKSRVTPAKKSDSNKKVRSKTNENSTNLPSRTNGNKKNVPLKSSDGGIKKKVDQATVTIKNQYQSPRLRAKQSVLQEPVVESDPEDSNEDSWEDESEESAEELVDNVHRTKKKVEKTMQSFSENYFRNQKSSKRVTSNRTMNKVELPKTNIQDLQKILKTIPEYHKDQKYVLYGSLKNLFKKWGYELFEGFNILLYGAGSKYQVLRNFCTDILEDCMCIEVNGFYPSLNIKKILNSITEDIIDHKGTFSNLQDHVEFIKEHFSTEDEDLYIVVHNIDGISLRGVKCQSALSSLACSPKIHFVASVDHLNCSLIWDQIMLNHFRWLWYDVTTYEPYILETSYENSLLREQSSQLVLSSLLHVFESLTPNSRGVFLILARYQLGKKDNSGMTFQEWYQECREAFLVNSEPTMDAQVSEFKSHKLLTSKKSPEGVECWYIPVASSTLREFLEKVER